MLPISKMQTDAYMIFLPLIPVCLPITPTIFPILFYYNSKSVKIQSFLSFPNEFPDFRHQNGHSYDLLCPFLTFGSQFIFYSNSSPPV